MKLTIRFKRTNRSYWIDTIIDAKSRVLVCHPGDTVIFVLNAEIEKSHLKAWHLVSFACLLDYTFRLGTNMQIDAGDDVMQYLGPILHLDRYFGDNKYVKAESDRILNLWQIVPEQSLIHSIELSKYLKRTFFKGKDVSLLQTMLDELYANVGDHSQSKGVAYSFVEFDEDNQYIDVAFCDFGIGIPTSLKINHKHPVGRANYIKYATERGVTIKSSEHNAGFGLATVLDCMEGSNHYIRIISNNEIYYHFNKNNRIFERTILLNNSFEGTLISYRIDVNQFQSEEILGAGDLLNDFEW